ncbi:MAG: TetR/AcrR family transcriptional regulator [Proteobacteria bacterium]|nr:TetR/AcrR family transcriptional regulator [Pseudomonadota bacterium]
MTDTTILQRSRGRPRDVGKDIAIRDAAWRVLAERGFDGLTFEAVAELANCSRATLYRRYASKVALVSAVLYETSRSVEPEIAPGSAPRDVLVAHACAAADYLSGYRGQALLNLTTAAFRHPELAAATASFGESEQAFYLNEFSRIAPEADSGGLAFACDTLLGSIIYHVSMKQRALAAPDVMRLVDCAIATLRD